MYYIGTGADGRVTAYTEADTNPDENLWVESPWEVPPDNFNDWIYADGSLIYDKRVLPEEDMRNKVLSESLQPADTLQATFTAMPYLTAALTDADAAKMIPYLPEYDATRDHDAARSYQEGEICLRSGKPARKTSIGWREIGA